MSLPFPMDVMREIWDYLEVKEVFNFLLVCKSLYKFCQEDRCYQILKKNEDKVVFSCNYAFALGRTGLYGFGSNKYGQLGIKENYDVCSVVKFDKGYALDVS